MRHSLSSILAAVMLAVALDPASRATAQTAPVELRILAINDFHGNLRPPTGGIRIADPDDRTKKIAVPAGGAEHMATLVKQLRERSRNTIFVAAGDLIGASPFLSAMFHDEPTIEALSMMGLEIASVGNHEFDEGKDELLRMQNGGCHPIDKCQGPHPFPGARFHYLAASTFEKSTGKTIFPALRDQGIRGHSRRLHRPDVEGHARHRLAGGRRRSRIPGRGRHRQRAGTRTEGARRRGHRRADPRRRFPGRGLQRVPGHIRTDRRHRQEIRSAPSTW